eukprot:gene11180-13018_t
MLKVIPQSLDHEFAHRHRSLLDTTQSFTSAGVFTFTIPPGVTSITATLVGASGGNAVYPSTGATGYGGMGGVINAQISVIPGEVLQINVGGQGSIGGPSGAGVNGGGEGCTHSDAASGSGGGASDIRRSSYTLNDRLAVAGGGGGGYSFFSAKGGDGGYPNGETGGVGDAGHHIPPTGGTATSGGRRMTVGNGCTSNGTFGLGASCCGAFGGGGGGGYWGGGHAHDTGGGGGSSYVALGSGVQLLYHGTAPQAGVGGVFITHDSVDPSVQPTVYPTLQPSFAPSTTSIIQSFTTVGVSSYVVPVGVTFISAYLAGASGGIVSLVANSETRTGAGGLGATISAMIPVLPGETLQINIGGQGGNGDAGEIGGGTGCSFAGLPSGGGGGATDIRRNPYSLNDRLIVAGGGGGGYANWRANGGNGGYPAGGNGGIGNGSVAHYAVTGGTATAGGTTTNPATTLCYNAGAFGVGASCCMDFGGGGGGGYWGGGNGYGVAGGGGSSFINVAYSVQLISHGVASIADSGSVVLAHLIPPTASPSVYPSIAPSVPSSIVTFTTVGAIPFVVPAGVTRVSAYLTGASGGSVSVDVNGDIRAGYGGKGDIISAIFSVTPGETLQINVGGQGGEITAGANGGGVGCTFGGVSGGGGGGASDIRKSPYTLDDRLIVAAGGGGGYPYWSARGGNGGYPNGENGQRGNAPGQYDHPTGGTATAGGTTSNFGTSYCYNDGTFGSGGYCCGNYGGGGGGGYWGGGHNYELAGAGGSSFISTSSGVQFIGEAVSSTEGPGTVTLVFTGDPTVQPTLAPTIQPSVLPSGQPSSQP